MSQSPTSGQPYPVGPWSAGGPVGKVRPTLTCILLAIVTLGIYTWFWFYGVHKEMQLRRGRGMGGGVALLLAIFFPIVLYFMTPSEAGSMYDESRQHAPVSAVTGFWILLPVIGALVWFIKTNAAINRYWEQFGA